MKYYSGSIILMLAAFSVIGVIVLFESARGADVAAGETIRVPYAMAQAFGGGRVDVYLVGQDLEKPALHNVVARDVLKTDGKTYYIFNISNDEKALVDSSQIAMLRLAK